MKIKNIVNISRALLMTLSIATLDVVASESKEAPSAVVEKLQSIVPAKSPDSITETQISGLYEARYGTTILYISADGRYLIDGSMLDLQTRANLTEQAIAKVRVDMLSRLDESEMINYIPESVKRTLTIFTDIDCQYCVKLHEERKQLLAAGIKLRYLLYPRAGFNSPSYNKAVTVWCSKDRAEALTDAKAGMVPDAIECENPILSQMSLATAFGLKGTPHIVIDDGETISGYMPAKALIKKLGQ